MSLRLGTLLLVVVATASACGEAGDGPPVQEPNTVVLDGQVANDHGSVAVSSAGERVPVEAGDFYFQPTVLSGPAGQPVVLEVTGSDSLHNLSVAEGDLDEDIVPGETLEVELVFPEMGTLVFVCKYHEVQGMAGALVAT
jgi:plastocyanin